MITITLVISIRKDIFKFSEFKKDKINQNNNIINKVNILFHSKLDFISKRFINKKKNKKIKNISETENCKNIL
ncbi:MAG: hypothetical protein Kow00103_07940 [Candidatus Caldatribacteriota bacterium]